MSYIYLRQNIKPDMEPGIAKRRAWLNLTEMRKAEVDQETKSRRYRKSHSTAFSYKTDPMMQAVDDRDEAEFYLGKLCSHLKTLVVLLFYHDVQVQAIAACSGQSRYQINRRVHRAMQIMEKI